MIALIEELKGFLKITWDSEDDLLIASLSRGFDYIKGRTGTNPDFTSGLGKVLLFNFVLYERANSLDEFAENYRSDLLQFVLTEGVRDNEGEGITDL